LFLCPNGIWNWSETLEKPHLSLRLPLGHQVLPWKGRWPLNRSNCPFSGQNLVPGGPDGASQRFQTSFRPPFGTDSQQCFLTSGQKATSTLCIVSGLISRFSGLSSGFFCPYTSFQDWSQFFFPDVLFQDWSKVFLSPYILFQDWFQFFLSLYFVLGLISFFSIIYVIYILFQNWSPDLFLLSCFNARY